MAERTNAATTLTELQIKAERTGAAATDTELTDGLSATLTRRCPLQKEQWEEMKLKEAGRQTLERQSPSMAVGGKTILRLTPALQGFDSSGFQQVTSISASAGAPLKETE